MLFVLLAPLKGSGQSVGVRTHSLIYRGAVGSGKKIEQGMYLLSTNVSRDRIGWALTRVVVSYQRERRTGTTVGAKVRERSPKPKRGAKLPKPL